ncbi:hypothetical protein KHQ82_00490 [Mycoplasmatota bacterium]|nr:hypothetical protein KHQ82_00490 [Mycoplasmatota bacterium]
MPKNYSPNDMKSMVNNTTSSHHKAAMDNHANQMNPTSDVYWSSRGGIPDYFEDDFVSYEEYVDKVIKPKREDYLKRLSQNGIRNVGNSVGIEGFVFLLKNGEDDEKVLSAIMKYLREKNDPLIEQESNKIDSLKEEIKNYQDRIENSSDEEQIKTLNNLISNRDNSIISEEKRFREERLANIAQVFHFSMEISIKSDRVDFIKDVTQEMGLKNLSSIYDVDNVKSSVLKSLANNKKDYYSQIPRTLEWTEFLVESGIPASTPEITLLFMLQFDRLS